MEKFSKVSGVAASFPEANIDTDAIISVAYQRSLKADFGKGLFANLRYDLEGNELPDFILNREPFRASKFIIGGRNFGCGSSREAAAYAVKGFGIRSVIAEGFSDIFYENCYKNGILAIVLPPEEIASLFELLDSADDPSITVDLLENKITKPDGSVVPFEIPEKRRQLLIKGLDEIGETLEHREQIDAFQARLAEQQPWLYVSTVNRS